MKRFCIAIIALAVLSANSYAGISVGLRGGYTYGGFTMNEVRMIQSITMTIPDTTIESDTTWTIPDSEKETDNPAGFGGELFCDIGLPGLPVSAEVGLGYFMESFVHEDSASGADEYTYSINSIKLSALGKYSIPGVPVVGPWVAVGPYLGLNTHNITDAVDSTMDDFNGVMAMNFGITGGLGVKVSLIPKMSFVGGVFFDYFIVSKGKMTDKETVGSDTFEMTIEPSNSQWNMNAMVGITYSIL